MIPSHILLCMWLHIHAGLINGAQCVATALRFSIHCGWGPFISCLRAIHVSHMDEIYIFENMGNMIMKMPARFNAALCSYVFFMMASSNWIIFRVTDPLWVEFTGHCRRIPHTKASDVELWCFFICARTNCWASHRDAGDFGRHRVHYDVTVMCCFV